MIIVYKALAGGDDVTKSFISSCMRKHPWTPAESCASRSALTNPPLQFFHERPLHYGEKGGVVELQDVVELEALPSGEGDHPSQNGIVGDWQPPLMTFL